MSLLFIFMTAYFSQSTLQHLRFFRNSPRYLEEDRPEIWLHLDVIITQMMDDRSSPERELLDFMKELRPARISLSSTTNISNFANLAHLRKENHMTLIVVGA